MKVYAEKNNTGVIISSFNPLRLRLTDKLKKVYFSPEEERLIEELTYICSFHSEDCFCGDCIKLEFLMEKQLNSYLNNSILSKLNPVEGLEGWKIVWISEEDKNCVDLNKFLNELDSFIL